MTGDQRDFVNGSGWETLFVAIDAHARMAFTAMHATGSSYFLHKAVTCATVLSRGADPGAA